MQRVGAASSRPVWIRIAAWGLVLFPILVVYAALWHEARAVPMADDFFAVLRFGREFEAQTSAGGKLLYLLGAQHNEYKLVVEHAVVAMDLELTGRMHLGLYLWMANVLLLAIGWLMWSNLDFQRGDLTARLFRFAPICWLLFQLNYVENLDWAMCGLQTVPVICFSLAAAHFLLREGRRNQFLCLSFAVLGCLSSANGFLMAPIGLVVLLAKKRYGWLPGWIAAYAVALAVYRFRYQPFVPPNYQAHVPFSQKVFFFLSVMGGAGENMHHFPVRYGSAVLGCALCAAIFMAWRSGFARRNPFQFCVASWCLLTAAVVAEKRVGEGLTIALSMRYKVYSDLLIVFLYAYGASVVERAQASPLKRVPRRVIYQAAMCGIILFCCVSDVFGYRFLDARRRFTEGALNSFAADPAKNSPEISAVGTPITGGDAEVARTVLVDVIASGLYRLPDEGKR